MTKLLKLTEVAELVRGVSFDKSDAVDDKADGYVPILRAGNIQEELITDEDLIWVKESKVSNNQLIQEGDIAICMSSGSQALVGKTAIARNSFNGAVGAFCGIIRPRENKILSKYLYFFTKSAAYKRWTDSAQGAGIKNIKKTSLESLIVPCPDLDEQSNIVSILSEIEKIIELKRYSDGLYKELLSSVFFHMFGDPVGNTKNLPLKRVDEICNLVRGSSPRPQGDPTLFGGPVPRLMIADITRDGVYVYPSIDSLTELGATKSRSMLKGDVVMAVSGAVGLPAILGIDACIHDGFVGFRNLDKNISPEYMYGFISAYRRFSIGQAVGATFQNLKTDQIKEWRIPIPSVDTQAEFLAAVEDVREIERKQTSAVKLSEDTYSSLLSKYFD